MKRILIAFLLIITVKSNSQQLLSCNTKEYTTSAPITIDGLIQDWQTILGNPISDPIFPFGNSSPAYDTYGLNDPDNPDSKIDIRVKTVAYDATNVFFYFRRLDNSNSGLKAFYFLDTNADGFLSYGEPVILINFNSQNVHKLSIGRYIPLNPDGDPIGQPFPGQICRIDGYPMKGTVDEFLNANKADLLPGEIFDASVTENGYGVELAVPWRFISTTKNFAYHLALQKGGGGYTPETASDNAGGCQNFLSVVGNPDFTVSNVHVTTITEGLSFRITLDYTNLTSTALVIDASTFITFKNIIQNDNLPIDESQFIVSVAGLPYPYYDGTFANQPIRYSNLLLPGAGVFDLDPFATRSISIVITFPPNYSVKSALVEIQPFSRFKLQTLCFPNVGGGGKPTNPIGVPVGDEISTTPGMNYPGIERGTNGKEIIVYPNPSNGSATLLLPSNKGTFDIQMRDYLGRSIKTWSNVNTGSLKLEGLPKGFYVLSIRSQDGEQMVKKLIVQ